jgi:hypothetical protein
MESLSLPPQLGLRVDDTASSGGGSSIGKYTRRKSKKGKQVVLATDKQIVNVHRTLSAPNLIQDITQRVFVDATADRSLHEQVTSTLTCDTSTVTLQWPVDHLDKNVQSPHDFLSILKEDSQDSHELMMSSLNVPPIESLSDAHFWTSHQQASCTTVQGSVRIEATKCCVSPDVVSQIPGHRQHDVSQVDHHAELADQVVTLTVETLRHCPASCSPVETEDPVVCITPSSKLGNEMTSNLTKCVGRSYRTEYVVASTVEHSENCNDIVMEGDGCGGGLADNSSEPVTEYVSSGLIVCSKAEICASESYAKNVVKCTIPQENSIIGDTAQGTDSGNYTVCENDVINTIESVSTLVICDTRDSQTTQIESTTYAGDTNPTVMQSVDDSDDSQYPSEDLLKRLEAGHDTIPLLVHTSQAISALAAKSAVELVNYFHVVVAPLNTAGTGTDERLCHVMWTAVILLSNPMLEIPTCVLLSTHAIYFVADSSVLPYLQPSPTQYQKLHCRHASDEVLCPKDGHCHTSLAIGQASSAGGTTSHSPYGLLSDVAQRRSCHVAKVYATMTLANLCQVHVGIFDQLLRLTGSDMSVIACVTRDHRITEEFIRQLVNVLNKLDIMSPLHSEKLEASSVPEAEQDFYQKFRSQRTGTDCQCSSHVLVIYPSDEAIIDLSFHVNSQLHGRKPAANSLRILFYLLCFQSDTLPQPLSESCSVTVDYYSVPCTSESQYQPRTIILTEEHLALAIEDHVSYPLPDFARMLPEHPHTVIVEVRYLEFLRRILVHSISVVVFIFTDETGEIVVDTRFDYYSADQDDRNEIAIHEVAWVMIMSNKDDLSRLLKVVSQQWMELHDGQHLPVIHV